MNILITAGPTREYIDPVRYLSNASSGKMGYSCAAAVVEKGHQAVLISGPVERPVPAGVKLIKVVSAEQMAEAVFNHFGNCDAVIMTAAVSDYRPSKKLAHKLEKTGSSIAFEFERTTDILEELGNRKQQQILVGFALQDIDPFARAENKLRQKNLDAIVLNSPVSLGADHASFDILLPDGTCENFPHVTKSDFARHIIDLTEKLSGKKGKAGDS